MCVLPTHCNVLTDSRNYSIFYKLVEYNHHRFRTFYQHSSRTSHFLDHETDEEEREGYHEYERREEKRGEERRGEKKTGEEERIYDKRVELPRTTKIN